MAEETAYRDEVGSASLLRELLRMQGSRCKACGTPLCGHETLMSLVAGIKDAPHCCSCLAVALERSREEMCDSLLGYILSRPCYHAGWFWANRGEGLEEAALPACLWPSAENGPPKPFQGADPMPAEGAFDSSTAPDEEWDAGNMGCGDLLLALRGRLQALGAGSILKLTARDPGAREDLPAWCRLTGHKLISANHPEYWIQRKES